MTELVRTVPSRSVGLDLVLGGGPRLLRRISGSDSESATLLVRGGPGAGKSVLAADFAIRMARAVGGDVLYVCIEILPSEVLAQRMGFDDSDATGAIDLAQPEARKASGTATTLIVGMTEMEMSSSQSGDLPDLGRMILNLVRISVERGCNPRVVVVDSLSDGYGLGAGVPRPTVDGVCKLAVEQGWVLVLVEETIEEHVSPWSFAVDTVLSLEVTPSGRRELRVTKHRFGPCQPGPHRLLVDREGVRVIPCFAAYRNAERDLSLPPPAESRSLRVQSIGAEPDWSRFDVPDGEGRLVIVQYHAMPIADPFGRFAASIGATAQNGAPHPGTRVALKISSSDESPLQRKDDGLEVGTLHPMIDGEEWLEAALSRLIACDSPLSQVSIGPTDRLERYEHTDNKTLQKAFSLLATILVRRGLVVVIYGVDVHSVVRSGAVAGEHWTVTSLTNPPPEHLDVDRHFGMDRVGFQAASM